MSAAGTPKRFVSLLNQRFTRLSSGSGLTTGLLILSSAALGGIAVALWNRKTLAAFHELEHLQRSSPDDGDPGGARPDDDTVDLF